MSQDVSSTHSAEVSDRHALPATHFRRLRDTRQRDLVPVQQYGLLLLVWRSAWLARLLGRVALLRLHLLFVDYRLCLQLYLL